MKDRRVSGRGEAGVHPGVILIVVWLLGLGCTTSFDPATLTQRPPDAGTDVPPVTDLGMADSGACGGMFQPCCVGDGSSGTCSGDLSCTGGYCVPCSGGTTACSGQCLDLQFDPRHCGACDNACGARQNCAMGHCQTPCPTGQIACGTDCVFVATDPANCGTCAHACVSPHASATCAHGACGLGACDTGWGDCNTNAADGCETDLTSTVTNCGACGNTCAFPNATGTCTAGACVLGPCTAGYADCDGVAGNGCETDTRSNAQHCGGCPMQCAPLQRCTSATCVTSTTVCSAGQADCAGSGACNDLSTDPMNCGACGNACALPHALAGCTAGACAVSACVSGYGDCDHDPSNGCEVNLQTTVSACGRCDRACTFPHASATCAAGACQLGACDAGWGNCDGVAANGCETDLTASMANCGACGNGCGFANAAAACTMGTCQLGACNPGFGDCDGAPGNGCEAALMTDPGNCGMCHSACTFANAMPTCAAGACQLGACAPGYADCNMQATDGCEASLTMDPANCGTCRTGCSFANAAPLCLSGACQIGACNAGWGDCNGRAADGCEAPLPSDPGNCGTCGHACRAGQVCALGSCVASCMNGQVPCAGGCVDVTASPSNCGACGHVCPTGPNASAACAGSACTVTCDPGWGDCNRNPSDGCEKTLVSDVNNCGACGSVCPPPPHAAATCAAGRCGYTCLPGYADCNGMASDGCEIALATDVSHCGGCTNVCTVAAGLHGTAACVRGTCGFTCMTGHADCDGIASNGCETTLATSAQNCGACGNRCWFANASATCTAGACSLRACDTGYGDCNGNPLDGCETSLQGNSENCGGCGVRCAPAPALNQRGQCNTDRMGHSTCGAVCLDHYADCNMNPADGCEVDLRQPSNCGHCGTTCTGLTPLCSPGGCNSIVTCPVLPGTTCLMSSECVRINSDIGNCGGCGARCATTGSAMPFCMGGTCGITCTTPMADCDGNIANGCETNLDGSPGNCGSCANTCGVGQYCTRGHCCPVGQNLCNGSCVDVSSDVNNCGFCGNHCPTGQVCAAGACTAH